MWFIVGIIVAAIAVSGIAWLWINHPPKEDDGNKSVDETGQYWTDYWKKEEDNLLTNPAYDDIPGNACYDMFKDDD